MSQTGERGREGQERGPDSRPAGGESLALAAALGAASLARKGAVALGRGAANGVDAALSGVWMVVTMLGLILGVLLGCAGALAAPMSLSLWAVSEAAPEAGLQGAGLALGWAIASAAGAGVAALWGGALTRRGADGLGEGAERFLKRRHGAWREALRRWMVAQERLGEFVFETGQEAAARPWSARAGGKALLGAALAAPGGLALGLAAGPGLMLLWIAEVGRAARIAGRALAGALRPAKAAQTADEAPGLEKPAGGWARRAALALAKEGAGTPAYARAQRRALDQSTPSGG